jgi:hypothetical protein
MPMIDCGGQARGVASETRQRGNKSTETFHPTQLPFHLSSHVRGDSIPPLDPQAPDRFSATSLTLPVDSALTVLVEV